MIPSRCTKGDKYCNKSALSCAAHLYSYSIVVQARVKENTAILQLSTLCTVELLCRSCSPGWSHRLIYLVHPLRLKLEYRNKGADHPTWAKHAGFKNTGG